MFRHVVRQVRNTLIVSDNAVEIITHIGNAVEVTDQNSHLDRRFVMRRAFERALLRGGIGHVFCFADTRSEGVEQCFAVANLGAKVRHKT